MLRDAVHDVLARYDDTPQAQLDVLTGLRERGRHARAGSVTAEGPPSRVISRVLAFSGMAPHAPDDD